MDAAQRRSDARVAALEAKDEVRSDAIGLLSIEVARLQVWVKVLCGVAGLFSPLVTGLLTAALMRALGG